VYEAADMVVDPHFQARGSLIEVPDDDHYAIVMPGVVPRLSDTPGSVRWTGPRLGRHTDEVLRAAGIRDDEIAMLRDSGVI
jgi:crotonobetainyl-CoA:carnitine CoA-transferase CaiB-like acyl-CoA transferase